MPDFKSELKKLETLNFDDEGSTPEEIIMHEDKIGISETMFNVIRDNPANSRPKLIALAEKAGVAKASSTSLITQFTKRGLVRKADINGIAMFFAEGDTYKPGYVKRPHKTVKAKPVKKSNVVQLPTNLKSAATTTELLDTLSIVQARALYDELKKIFGG